MNTVISAEIAAKTIWDILKGNTRDISNSEYAFGLKMLYFRHRTYDIVDIALPIEGINDEIVELLNIYIFMNSDIEYTLRQYVESIPFDIYQELYPELLFELFRLRAMAISRSSEMTPPEINKLLSYLAISNGCKSLYDPFCGSAGILNFLPTGSSFLGQELARISYIEACLTAEIFQDKITINLLNENSIWDRSIEVCDGIVSTPPFSASLSEKEKEAIEYETNVRCNFIDDLPIVRGLRINHAKVTITVLPHVFCFGNGHRDVRRFIVNNNYIDTIISLPRNVLYGTGIKPIVLICRKDKLIGSPVRFIFADNFVIGNNSRNRKLDVDRLIADLNSSSNLIESFVSNDEIIQNDYTLIPEVYYPISRDEIGTSVVKLRNLITPIQGQSNIETDEEHRFVADKLSGSAIEVILNANSTSERETAVRDLKYYSNDESKKHLIDLNLGGNRRYALQTSSEPFMCSRNFKVYCINENLVDPKYLAYLLLSSEPLRLSNAPLSSMLDMKIPIFATDHQKEIVKRLTDEYLQNKDREAKADRERLGKKTVQSEIEHILGVTQHKIGRLLDNMLSNKPSDDQYFNYVKKLKDNFDYMGRVIHFTNMPIESFNLTKGDLSAFMEEYVTSWQNYGSGVFSIKLDNNLEEKTEVNFDRTMMTVMLDAILDNASRHGFQKRESDANELIISLDLVTENESAYIVISIANNGRPMADGFTIDDYISRGRYSATSGRSGLGGFHAYQVAKGHGGFISLSSNNQWSVIIDVLIPAPIVNIENLPTYGKEYR